MVDLPLKNIKVSWDGYSQPNHQPAWELKGDPKGGFRFVMVVPLAIIQRKWMTIFGTESYGIVDPT